LKRNIIHTEIDFSVYISINILGMQQNYVLWMKQQKYFGYVYPDLL